MRDLPWNELPPIPEGKGTPERRARRKDMWRSVLTQQLQADMLACDMASQLLNIAPDLEAQALLLDDGAGRVAPHRGVAEARRRGRRHRRARPASRQPRAHDARGGHARGEGLPDAGLLRATDHLAVPADRPLVARHGARGSLQPPGDRRRHPSRRRHGVRARPPAERVEEDERRRSSTLRTACCPSSRRTRSGGRASARGSGARWSRATSSGSRRISSSACGSPSRSGSTSATSSSRFPSPVPATLMDGAALAARIRGELKEEIATLGARRARDRARRRRPGLGRSTSGNKHKAAEEVGIRRDRPPARRRHVRGGAASSSSRAQRGRRGRRDPRPDAAAGAHRRGARHAGARPDEGRRRPAPLQRRPALPRQPDPRPRDPARGHAAARRIPDPPSPARGPSSSAGASSSASPSRCCSCTRTRR